LTDVTGGTATLTRLPPEMTKGLQLQALGILLAEWTGLEPATPGVTGRYSNQLNYHSIATFRLLETSGPSAAKLGDPTGIRTPVLTVKG
jgi:hypothetical protein